MSFDSETGEIINEIFINTSNDIETGECFGSDKVDTQVYIKRKSKFNVPKTYLMSRSLKESKQKKQCLSFKKTHTLFSKEQVIQLKEKIFLGYNKTSHRLFLIPSLILYPRLAAILLIVVEIVLHIMSHKNNTTNINPNLYYRSPLHTLTSQFCSLCIETKELHNERYHKKKNVHKSFG